MISTAASRRFIFGAATETAMAEAALEQEVRDLRRRLDLAETCLSQLGGQFGFVSGQFRDIQLYIHARFDDVDKRLDQVETRLERVEVKVDRVAATVETLPRVLVEEMQRLLDERLPRR